MTLDKFLKDLPRRRIEDQKKKEIIENANSEKWKEFSNNIEEHPIFMPRIVRGT